MKAFECGKFFLIGMICMLFSACQMLPEEGQIMDSEGTLKVRTRSAASVEMAYPVYLYAFSEEGKCQVSQEIEDESEKIELRLSAGTYRVVAVSGISDAYSLPSNPVLDDVIMLESETGAETPLLVGKADVTISDDKEATLDITLSYVVTAVQAMLTNIPEEISAVTMTLSSFHTSLSMDGVYGGDPQVLEISCLKSDEDVWESDTTYVFPGSSSETVFSIQLKKEDGTTLTYGYTWKESPKANQPLRISGNYSQGIAVSGNFVVNNWDTAVDIDFEFGDAVDEEEDGDEVEVECSSIPEAGSIWYDCIVAQVGEFDGVGVDILLMSLDEWSAPVASALSLIEGYKVNDLGDWRLPNDEEAKMLRDNYNGDNLVALNKNIAAFDDELTAIDANERYLCLKEDEFYSYAFVDGKGVTIAGTKKAYYIRLVKSCYLTFEE